MILLCRAVVGVTSWRRIVMVIEMQELEANSVVFELWSVENCDESWRRIGFVDRTNPGTLSRFFFSFHAARFLACGRELMFFSRDHARRTKKRDEPVLCATTEFNDDVAQVTFVLQFLCDQISKETNSGSK